MAEMAHRATRYYTEWHSTQTNGLAIMVAKRQRSENLRYLKCLSFFCCTVYHLKIDHVGRSEAGHVGFCVDLFARVVLVTGSLRAHRNHR